ncbi:MAG: hypothetical protein AB8B68_02540 [Rickettsiaceae bacterium]
MRKTIIIFFKLVFLLSISTSAIATTDIIDKIPEIEEYSEFYKKIPDVAMYKEADWINVVGVSNNISVSEAFKIADTNPKITFFFYVQGGRMVLETKDDKYRVFNHGDVVFFTGDPWWGSAPELSDGYIKKSYSDEED